MPFEHIEELKREYTDKYVVVDDTKPELRRFKNQTGQVRSVNMSGRALVQFDAYENIGWYDIEIDFLKVVDKPLPKEETAKKKPAAKAKTEDKPKPAVPAAGGAKMSVADMLAAARGAKGGDAAKPPAEAPSSEEPPKAESNPATKSTQSMNVADMLAAAQAEKPAPKAPEAAAMETPVAEPAAPAPAETTISEAGQSATPNQDIPTDTAGILDYCRKTDG